LDEARHDLLLAQSWAREDGEINDALYNLAGIAALQGRTAEAISLVRDLIARDRRWAGVVAGKGEYFASLRHDPEFQELTTGEAC